MTAWELVDGSYRHIAHATGAAAGFEVTAPFAVRFIPESLLS